MNILIHKGWIYVLALHLAAGITTQADTPATKPENVNKQNVRALFDGKTLTNWQITDFGGQGNVTVEAGELRFTSGEPLTGVHWKEDKDSPSTLPRVNYELTLEAMKTQGEDFFLALTFPVQETHCTLVLGGWGGSLVGLSSLNGLDASENETTDILSFDKNHWYPVRVRVTEKKIEAWLENRQIIDVDYTNMEVGLRLEMELCRPLGLASFMASSAYRNIQLKTLNIDR